MFGSIIPSVLSRPETTLRRGAIFGVIALILFVLFGQSGGALAAEGEAAAAPTVKVGKSGLPLPRFATTRSSPINVRVGPGERYDVVWIYMKPGTPVEIIEEFDTWRQIRDADGSVGWVHQNLLSGKRAAVAVPQAESQQVALLAGRNVDGGVRAFLTAGFRVEIAKCDGKWCEVSATYKPKEGSASTYWGFVQQGNLWGVYAGEEVD